MSDDDIEFLDEDAEIVQKCVHSVLSQTGIKAEPEEHDEPPVHVIQKSQAEPLLIERSSSITKKSVSGKKRKKDDDTDYDPIVDSPYFNRKRRHNPRKTSTVHLKKYETGSRSSLQSSTSQRSSVSQQSPPARKAALPREQINRRDMTIRIPDFDDPLCLPVRALVKDENDARRLKHWNQLCLDQFKNNDTALQPHNGPVSSSKRLVVIRNLFNKHSGKTETTFWSKMTVEGAAGDTKSDVVQSVLPRYREKKILTAYKLDEAKRRRNFRDRYEVILTKEKHGDEELLVAYKPENSLSMVFKMFESELVDVPEEDKRYLLELASCTACARCYQASWRPPPASDGKRAAASARCPVCARASSSPPALLAHLKTHVPEDIRMHRQAISVTLAKLLPHQYRCRVCQRQFPAVRDLRRHLPMHRGAGEFYCEVGDHAVC